MNLFSCFRKKPEPEHKQAARLSLKALEGVLFAVDMKEPAIKDLWAVYNAMDVDNTGFVPVQRFETLMGIEYKPFMRRITLSYNFDESGVFDFPEYLMMVWTYCTTDDYNLYIYLYEMIDVEKAGFVQGKELEDLIRDVFGSDWNRIPEARLLIREVPLGNMQQSDVRKYFLSHTHLFKRFTDFREVMRKTAQPVDTINFWQELTRKKTALRGDRLKNAMSLLQQVLKEMKPPVPVEAPPEVVVRKGPVVDGWSKDAFFEGQYTEKKSIPPVNVFLYMERDEQAARRATARVKQAKRLEKQRQFRDWKKESLLIVRDNRHTSVRSEQLIPTTALPESAFPPPLIRAQSAYPYQMRPEAFVRLREQEPEKKKTSRSEKAPPTTPTTPTHPTLQLPLPAADGPAVSPSKGGMFARLLGSPAKPAGAVAVGPDAVVGSGAGAAPPPPGSPPKQSVNNKVEEDRQMKKIATLQKIKGVVVL